MDVSIIGGGIAGLVLALTLHKQSVKCTIYELRDTADIANPGAVGLAPNALRCLDKLGLLEELRHQGWPLTTNQYRSESDEVISSTEIGGTDLYGYDTIRIVRRRFHDVLLSAVHAVGIEIISGKKYSHIISKGPSGVTFAFKDGSEVTTSVLIGADGIHSAVREAIEPGTKPEFKGSLSVVALLKQNPLLHNPQLPSLKARLHSISVTQGTHASFIAITQSADGEEISLGLDRPFPDQSREKWDALLANQQQQYDIFIEDYDKWPETIQAMMREAKVENMYRSWPFYALPDLQQWSAPDRRVVLIGDAAHAIPPSAGQGACMAIEDAWSLGLVLGSCQRKGIDVQGEQFQGQMTDWQTERRDRVGKIRRLTEQAGNLRLPKEMRKELTGEFDYANMSWLYGYEYEKK